MKKVIAVLLSLLLLPALPPAGAATTPETALTAFLADPGVQVDGVLSEKNWFLKTDFSGGGPQGKLAVQWDGTALYVGAEFGDAEQLSLTVGTETVVCSLVDGSLTPGIPGAEAAIEGSVLELALPAAPLGLTVSGPGQEIVFAASLQKGEATSSIPENMLRLTDRIIRFSDNCDRFEGYSESSLKFGDYGSITIGPAGGTAGAYTFAGAVEGSIKGITRPFAFSGGAYDVEFTLDIRALPVISDPATAVWRGFVLELPVGGYRYRFSVTKDEASGEAQMNLMYAGTDENGSTQSAKTGVKEGERATFRLSVAQDNRVKLFVNGVQTADFPAMDYSAAAEDCISFYVNFAGVKSGTLDVDLHDFLITAPRDTSDTGILDTLLSRLTFAEIRGGNTSEDMVTEKLELPDSLQYFGYGTEYPVTWSCQPEDAILSDGTLAGALPEGQVAELTASVEKGGITRTKTFELIIYQPLEQELLYLENDLNPYTGQMTATKVQRTFTLDQTYNSVGYDLGVKQKVNQVILTDDDGVHKLHRIDLSLYVSDDNQHFTRIAEFDFARAGKECYLYNFEAEARYVKVHCHYDTAEDAGFTNLLSSIIRADCEAGLPGSGGGSFQKLGTVQAASMTAGERTDAVAYLPYRDLGIDPSQYQADRRDLRFAEGGQMLPYYLDMKGVYVRIPSVGPGGEATVDIYGGNEQAVSLSDFRAVFEATYGNKTVMDLTLDQFSMNIAVTRAPSGALLAMGNFGDNPHTLTMRTSQDGGRTWSQPRVILSDENLNDGGGFLVDEGSIWYSFHRGQPIESPDKANLLKVAVMRSDDNGESWSTPVTVNTGYYYHVTYCDGIRTAAYDGDGPEIDYVIPYHFMETEDASFQVSVIFSCDAGVTWQNSDSKIDYELPASGLEGGPTEAAIAVLSDGTLKMLMRCQYKEVTWFCEATSSDNGRTWTQATASNITATNGMPALKDYGGDQILVWAGNNAMGGESYARYPLTIAYSQDDMATWNQKLDLYSGTSMGMFPKASEWWKNPSANLAIQPSMAITQYGESQDLLIGWWGNWMTNRAMLIEDFDDFLYRSKGAANDFEGASAKYEGWYAAEGYGTVRLTAEEAESGLRALKVEDAPDVIVRATRSVPAMRTGEIALDLKLKEFSSGCHLEFKSAYSNTHYTADVLMISIDGAGRLTAKDLGDGNTDGPVLAAVQPNEWNHLAVRFDLAQNTAQLYLNGELKGAVPVSGEEITTVQLSDGSSSETPGLLAYVDNFAAYEGVSLRIPQLSDSCSVTALSMEGSPLNFAPDTLLYTTSVPNSRGSTRLTIGTEDASTAVTVNGEAYSGDRDIPLAVGLNTLVIRAESASRMNRVEYTLVINREKAAVYVETGGTAVTPKPSYSLKEQRTGYIGGYPDGTFRPEQAVTRGEMAQMLFELLAFENVTPKHPYEDVKGTWVDNAVGVLYTLEIIRDAGASFRMDEPASRAEFVQALGRLLKLDGAAAEGFADTIGHPQEALFSAFKKAGILQGYPDGTVRPDGEMTRAEMIVILNRVLELPDQTGASIFQDVPDSHWACAAINAAADRS